MHHWIALGTAVVFLSMGWIIAKRFEKENKELYKDGIIDEA